MKMSPINHRKKCPECENRGEVEEMTFLPSERSSEKMKGHHLCPKCGHSMPATYVHTPVIGWIKWFDRDLPKGFDCDDLPKPTWQNSHAYDWCRDFAHWTRLLERLIERSVRPHELAMLAAVVSVSDPTERAHQFIDLEHRLRGYEPVNWALLSSPNKWMRAGGVFGVLGLKKLAKPTDQLPPSEPAPP